MWFTALFLAREDKADVFVSVLLKENHQLEEAHFMGNALNGADIKHICQPSAADGENLFAHIIGIVAPPA